MREQGNVGKEDVEEDQPRVRRYTKTIRNKTKKDGGLNTYSLLRQMKLSPVTMGKN